MLNTLLGSKGKMGNTYIEDTRVAVSNIKVGPCVVTQVKSKEKDGYWAVQLGFAAKKIKNVSKPMQGHLKTVIKEKIAPRFLKEVRFEKKPDLKVGDIVRLEDVFKKGDLVAITGISKGKGFAGVVKRWGFAGGPKTHGQSDRLRAPGAIGQGTSPGRVWKGKKMAGRMGSDRITIRNLVVVALDPKNCELAVSGSVPGTTGGLLLIKKTGSGKLSELIEEVPQVQVQQEEEIEPKKEEVKNEAGSEEIK